MEPNAQKPQDIVDTTDSLEAVGACRSMKNFLFFVLLLSLLLTQVVFWLDRLGLVEEKVALTCPGGRQSCPASEVLCPAAAEPKRAPAPAGLLPLAATVNVAEEVEKVAEQVEQKAPEQPDPVQEAIVTEDAPQTETAETSAQPAQAEAAGTPFAIPYRLAGLVMVICNFLIIAGSILYCLTMLMCLKISLAGRLGGMNHMTRAFFISLFFMVIVFPWQQLLPGVLVGTVWLPGEYFGSGWAKAEDMAVWNILFYLRFCGLWLLAMWFLFWAQSRSAKWARATLRRLGVAR